MGLNCGVARLGLLAFSLWAGLAAAQHCTPDLDCWPSSTVVGGWIKTLRADTTVLTPYGPNFVYYLSEAHANMNTLKTSFPGLIIHPGNENDLRSVLRFASKYRIRVVAKCSGHDQNCRSTGRGVIQVVMDKFKRLSYNPIDESISFGAGANHGEIYAFNNLHGRVTVGGQFKTVCPAGCLTGGCHGPLSRLYGLGIDQVQGIRFALFNGTILNLAPNRSADLFNALLGAGASSFGVAISFRVKSYPKPPVVVQVGATFTVLHPEAHGNPDSELPNLLSTYFFNVTWWSSLPLGLAGYFSTSQTGEGTHIATIEWVYSGDEPSELEPAIEPVLTSPFVMPGTVSINYFESLAGYSEAAYSQAGLYYRKFVFNSLLPPVQEVLDAATSALLAYPSLPTWIWYTYGGAAATGTAGHVPPGMRDGMIQINTAATWLNPEDDKDTIAGISAALPLFYSLGESSYSNEYTSWGGYNAPANWKARFFSNYTQLVAVKKKYDPCNLYNVQYGVGWDLPKATCSK